MTFKLDAAGPGRSVTLGGACATTFPDLRTTAAWTMGNDDALYLVDDSNHRVGKYTLEGKKVFDLGPAEHPDGSSSHATRR